MSKSQLPTVPGQFGPDQQQNLQWQHQPPSYPPQQETEYPQYPPQQQWQQPPMQPMQPVKPPRKRRVERVLGIGCGSVVALIVLIVIIMSAMSNGATTNSNTNSNTNTNPSTNTLATPTAHTTSQPTTAPTLKALTPTPVLTFATFTDGTFQVGIDIQPGTYRTQTGSPGCYYARLKGFGGTVDDILANNNTDNPTIVTILPSDKGFESQNCGTWTKDLSQITTSKTNFNDGMYIVGTDIQPGTYKNTASSGCYYARLSGFSNSIDSINANNNTDAAAIVTISASDKGFESTRCGTWTKL